MEQIEFGSKVRVRLDPQTMDIRLETAFGRYASRAEFRPYFIDMEGERVPFSAAEQRSAVRWDCGTGSAARVRPEPSAADLPADTAGPDLYG